MFFLKKYIYQVYPELIISNKFDIFFIFSLGLSPILFLTISGWTNFFLLILVILSIFKIISEFKNFTSQHEFKNNLWIIITLAGSFISVLLAQIIRGSWQPNLIDGPSRALLSIAIFFYLLKKNIDFVKLLEYIIPISLIILFFYIYFNPYNYYNLTNRFGTKSVDPLTLGQYATLFGFICLFTINIYKRDHWIIFSLKIIGIASAIFISIGTASRSGWVAAPFLLIIWATKSHQNHQSKKVLLTFIAIISIIFATYKFIPIVNERLSLATSEYINYFSGGNKDNPTGTRISMLRAAGWLFIEKPFSGYGDSNYPSFSNIKEIALFNSEYLESTMTNSGAHNEIVQSALRSGVFGLISSILMFITPTLIFYRGSKSRVPTVRAAGLVGLCYIVAIFFFSLSTETFNLKYTISFYALMVSALAAQVLRPQPV